MDPLGCLARCGVVERERHVGRRGRAVGGVERGDDWSIRHGRQMEHRAAGSVVERHRQRDRAVARADRHDLVPRPWSAAPPNVASSSSALVPKGTIGMLSTAFLPFESWSGGSSASPTAPVVAALGGTKSGVPPVVRARSGERSTPHVSKRKGPSVPKAGPRAALPISPKNSPPVSLARLDGRVIVPISMRRC
jgi:hypothetical protein